MISRAIVSVALTAHINVRHWSNLFIGLLCGLFIVVEVPVRVTMRVIPVIRFMKIGMGC